MGHLSGDWSFMVYTYTRIFPKYQYQKDISLPFDQHPRSTWKNLINTDTLKTIGKCL